MFKKSNNQPSSVFGPPSSEPRPLVIWDIDDVLNSFMLEWFCSYKATSGCILNYENLSKNPPHDLLGISKQEYLNSLDLFRKSSFSKLKPREEVLKWFQEKGEEFQHVALTAIPFNSVSFSAEWCMKHFGKWIRSFNYVPSAREGEKIPEYFKTKKDFLANFGKVDLFIDDNEDNIRDAQSLGIKTILFPAPWNSNRNQSIEFAIKEMI